MDGAPRVLSRVRSRVDELPPEARETIDEMLASQEPVYTYQDISDALTGAGYTVSKSAVGRYAARMDINAREVQTLVRQTDAMLQYLEDHPGFDVANAMLSLMVGRLSSRLIGDPGILDKLPPDKAAASMIQASRVAAQYEKITGDRKKKAAARGEVIGELREALEAQPELLSRLEALIRERTG